MKVIVALVVTLCALMAQLPRGKAATNEINFVFQGLIPPVPSKDSTECSPACFFKRKCHSPQSAVLTNMEDR